jgi:ribosomal protein S18 acetylase RimI-like enzyme
MSALTIIQADVSHALLLTSLSLQSFREAFEKDNNPEDFKTYVDEAFSEEQLNKDIKEPGSIFYLAYYNGEAVGYARLRNSTEINDKFPGKKLIELHRLYTLGKYIGRGIGKALMNHCLHVAKQKGFEVIWLGVWEHNDHAQGFYKSFGFEKFSSHVFMVGNDPQTDYLLKKNL